MSDLIDRKRFSADMLDFQNRVGIWRDEAEDTETRTRADAALATIIETKLILDKQPTIPAPRWHRVEEPPKKDGRYFVCRFDYMTKSRFYDCLWYQKGTWWDGLHTGDYAVTHWMPIEPPKEDAK